MPNAHARAGQPVLLPIQGSASPVQQAYVLQHRHANVTNRLAYSSAARPSHAGSLVDGGANGGVAGDDVVVLNTTGRFYDVTGVTEDSMTDLPIGQVASKIRTSDGFIIGVFSQYAVLGRGKTVHSCGQLHHFGIKVDDVSRATGGTQRVTTPDGYIIPLHVRDGLCYMDMEKPHDDDLTRFPYVFFTADMEWDPTVLDNDFSPDDNHGLPARDPDFPLDPRVNDFGEVYRRDPAAVVNECCLHAHGAKVGVKEPDYPGLRPCLDPFGSGPAHAQEHNAVLPRRCERSVQAPFQESFPGGEHETLERSRRE
jgi:hypothetical protein